MANENKKNENTKKKELAKSNLDVLIMQWNQLSKQVQQIDDSHWKVFTIVITVFGLSSFSSNELGVLPIVLWILPILVSVLLFYEAFNMRDLAVLVGYLAKIEDAINTYHSKAPEKNLLSYPASWFSRYRTYYSSKKGLAKRLIIIPAIIAVLFTFFVCGYFLVNSNWTEAKASDSNRIISNCILKWVYFGLLVFAFIIDLCAFIDIICSINYKKKVYEDKDSVFEKTNDQIWPELFKSKKHK